MLCSENPSGSKGCCHRMCCCCEAKGLFLPLFALLCLSKNGIEVAESEPPQSRCGNESGRCMAASCKSPSLFSQLCCYTHYQGSERKTLKNREHLWISFQANDCNPISFLLNHHSRHFQAFLRSL